MAKPEPNRPSQFAAKKFPTFRFPQTKQPMQIVLTPTGFLSYAGTYDTGTGAGVVTALNTGATIIDIAIGAGAILALSNGQSLPVYQASSGGSIDLLDTSPTSGMFDTYTTGTVDTVAGSRVVEGSSTAWTTVSNIGGKGFMVLGDNQATDIRIIDRPASNTQLLLRTPYAAKQTGAFHIIGISGTLCVPQAAYAFDEPSYWTCQQCNLAIHKKDLLIDPVTGKFVCPLDYNHLGVKRLEAETGYQASAIQADADDFVEKSEWP